jgi:hypothetical protein
VETERRHSIRAGLQRAARRALIALVSDLPILGQDLRAATKSTTAAATR